jgi:hypothetical protein
MTLNKMMENWWDLVAAAIVLIACMLFTVRDQKEEPTTQRRYAMAETSRYCHATAAQEWHSDFLRRFAEQRCMNDILETARVLQAEMQGELRKPIGQRPVMATPAATPSAMPLRFPAD